MRVSIRSGGRAGPLSSAAALTWATTSPRRATASFARSMTASSARSPRSSSRSGAADLRWSAGAGAKHVVQQADPAVDRRGVVAQQRDQPRLGVEHPAEPEQLILDLARSGLRARRAPAAPAARRAGAWTRSDVADQRCDTAVLRTSSAASETLPDSSRSTSATLGAGPSSGSARCLASTASRRSSLPPMPDRRPSRVNSVCRDPAAAPSNSSTSCDRLTAGGTQFGRDGVIENGARRRHLVESSRKRSTVADCSDGSATKSRTRSPARCTDSAPRPAAAHG